MGEGNKDKRRRKKRGGAKRRMTAEQTLALKSVNEWVNLAKHSSSDEVNQIDDDFLPEMMCRATFSEKVVFELHSHSICSDGFLTPSALVEKAHQNGVSFFLLIFHRFNYAFLLFCDFQFSIELLK